MGAGSGDIHWNEGKESEHEGRGIGARGRE